MKILSFTPSQYNKTTSGAGKISNVSCAKAQNCDSFVKSNNVSFSGGSTFAQKFEPFMKEFNTFFSKNEPFDYIKLRSLITKYNPVVNVKSMDEISGPSNVTAYTAAYFRDLIGFSNTGEMINADKTLFVDLPKSNSYMDRLKFGDFFVHEATHAFQECSSDRVSKFDFTKEFFKPVAHDREALFTLQVMPQVFTAVEQNLLRPLANALKKDGFLPIPIKSADEKIVDNIIKSQTGADVKTIVAFVSDNMMQKFGGPRNPNYRNKVLEFVQLIAQKEREAYNNGLGFLKQQLSVNSKTDLDLQVILYDMISSSIK